MSFSLSMARDLLVLPSIANLLGTPALDNSFVFKLCNFACGGPAVICRDPVEALQQQILHCQLKGKGTFFAIPSLFISILTSIIKQYRYKITKPCIDGASGSGTRLLHLNNCYFNIDKKMISYLPLDFRT